MSLAGYFVKSEGHRRLFELLFSSTSEYSALELANLSGLPYATVHAELLKLHKAGAVENRIGGRAKYFKGSVREEQRKALAVLFGFHLNDESHQTPSEDEVKARLQDAGAPVVSQVRESGTSASLEDTVVRAALLARKDPSVARALPVAMARHANELDFALLLMLARRLNAKQEVGFFLALTGTLNDDSRLTRLSQRFKDQRVRQTQDFFTFQSSTDLQRTLAEKNTPLVARRWKFRMNMSLESFKSTYDRFKNELDRK